MIHNMVGGGSGKLFAVIAVTYPSGSICTCDGKAAQDTSGYALFNVKVGTHTVESHTSDNSQSKSTSVTVADSDAGKVIDVALSYGLVLFDKDAGIDRTDLTGGFAMYDGYVGFNTSTDSTGGYGIMSGNKVADIANYSSLVVETGDITAPKGAYMGIASNTAASAKYVYSSMTSKVSIDSNGAYSLDISGISASNYIALCCYNDGASTRSFTMRVKRIYLQ